MMRARWTDLDITRWDAAVFTARVTGRVIFGQLWMPDPTLDDLLHATYAQAITDLVGAPSALYVALYMRRDEARRTP